MTLLQIIKSLDAIQMTYFLNRIGAQKRQIKQALRYINGLQAYNSPYPSHTHWMNILCNPVDPLTNTFAMYEPGIYQANAILSDNESQSGFVVAQNAADAEILFRGACLRYGKIPVDICVIKTEEQPVLGGPDCIFAIHGDWERTIFPPLLAYGKNKEPIMPSVESTEKGEPQCWLPLSDETSLEITSESAGLLPHQCFYSIRRHCSENDFDDGTYADTMGVISSDTVSLAAELQPALDILLARLRQQDIYPNP